MSHVPRVLLRASLRLYPRRWRERYGDEVLALAEDAESGIGDVVDLALGALRQRVEISRGGASMASHVNYSAAAVAGVAALILAAPTAAFIVLNLAGQDVAWQPGLVQVLPALPLVALLVALAPAIRVGMRSDRAEAHANFAVTVRVLSMPGWLLAVIGTCAVLVAGVLAYGISDAFLEAVR